MEEPVIDLLEAEWASIMAVCATLDDDQWQAPTDCPGWSVKDNVSHLVGIENMLRGAVADPPVEQRPAHVRNDFGAFNEAAVAARRGRAGAEVLDEFRSEITSRLTGNERREYASRARGRPLFYTEMFPQRWQEFRRSRLTLLLTKIRSTVKSRRPRAMLTAAVFPDANDAANRRFQDWAGWLQTGLLDAICPMAYTTDPALFRTQIANVEQLAGPRQVWAGIGAYQLSPAATVDNIRAARQLGAEGIILFSYDNLDSRYVDTVAKGAFTP